MNEAFRAFIGVELNQEIRDFISSLQIELENLTLDIKWVKPENAHLTFKFLGNINKDQSSAISRSLKILFENQTPYSTSLSEIGYFPEHAPPRIIWLGINDPKKVIQNWARQIDSAMEKLGFPRADRAFKAHITIGRLRSLKNIRLLTSNLKNRSIDKSLSLCIGTINLYNSSLTSAGPVYEISDKIEIKNPCR